MHCGTSSYRAARMPQCAARGSGQKGEADRVAQLEAEVALLTEALGRCGISPDPLVCDCCDGKYIPVMEDHGRCPSCHLTCHFDGDGWVQGVRCPARKGVAV